MHLPVPSEDDVQCAVGLGETDGCEAEGAGTDTLTVTTGPLDDHTPVSIKTGLDLPVPDQDKDVPWAARWDRTLSTSPVLLGIVILLALLAGVLGAVLARMTYERNPQFPLMYGPPDGIGPAQGKYVLTESIDKEAYVATLMHAAQHGAVDLQRGHGQLGHHGQGRARRVARPGRGLQRRRPPAVRPGHVVRRGDARTSRRASG